MTSGRNISVNTIEEVVSEWAAAFLLLRERCWHGHPVAERMEILVNDLDLSANQQQMILSKLLKVSNYLPLPMRAILTSMSTYQQTYNGYDDKIYQKVFRAQWRMFRDIIAEHYAVADRKEKKA